MMTGIISTIHVRNKSNQQDRLINSYHMSNTPKSDWMNAKAKQLAKEHCDNRISEITTQFQVEQFILLGMNLSYLKFRPDQPTGVTIKK